MLMIGGTLTNYIKTMEMTRSARQRMSDPTMKKADDREENGVLEQMKRLQEDTKRQQEAAVVQGIKSRLMSGMELSINDLETLKEKAPELYKQAIQAIHERREHEKKLSQCRTKDEVQRVHLQRVQSYVGEMQQIGQTGGAANQVGRAEGVLIRMTAVRSEHIRFLGSARYAKLPWEYEKEKQKPKSNGVTRGYHRQRVAELERKTLEQKMERMLDEIKREQEAALGAQAEQKNPLKKAQEGDAKPAAPGAEAGEQPAVPTAAAKADSAAKAAPPAEPTAAAPAPAEPDAPPRRNKRLHALA